MSKDNCVDGYDKLKYELRKSTQVKYLPALYDLYLLQIKPLLACLVIHYAFWGRVAHIYLTSTSTRHIMVCFCVLNFPFDLSI